MAESADARLPAAAYVEFTAPLSGVAPADALEKILRANPGLPQGEMNLTVGKGLMVNFPHPTQTLAFAREMIALAREERWGLPPLRIGLHVSVMSRAADADMETTLSGGSIDGAMRMASVAEPNQALASPQFQTVVLHLLKLGPGLLAPLGKRTTPSGKVIEVFEVTPAQPARPAPTPAATPPAPAPASPAGPAPARAPVAAPAAAAAKTDDALTPEQMGAIEQALAEEIGPIAKLLIKQAAAHLPDQNRFLLHLADVVPDPERRRAFLIKATRLTN